MIISIDVEKRFCFDQCPVLIKNHNKLGVERNFLYLIKDIYRKPTANIVYNGEKFKAFTLMSGTRQGCVFHHFFFNIILQVLDKTVNKFK